MARSHIKLWLGHLVISNSTSRHREEQYGDVPAFIIGDRCFAWWSNEQLRRLTERRRHERDFAWWYNEQLRRLGERRQQKRELLRASHNLGDFAENDTKDENSWWNGLKHLTPR